MLVQQETPGERPDPERVVGKLDALPTLPVVVIRLFEISADRDSSFRELAEVIHGDPALAAKVLSVASSASFGVGRQVTTLQQAVALLGFAAVRSIVLATCVFQAFENDSEPTPEGGFQRREFWLHSIATACAAQRIAKAAPRLGVESDEAFLGGLLHDLGKVALDAVFPKAYDRIAARAANDRGDISDLERTILGADHTRAGRRLAERWKLPATYRDVIWLHHLAPGTLPASVENPQLIAVVQLADTLVREQRLGYSGNFRFYEYSPRVARNLGLDVATIEQALTGLVAEVSEYARLLGLERESPETIYIKAIGSANAELGRINTELAESNRRLSAAARFFRALEAFETHLSSWSDPGSIIPAIAHAATIGLERSTLAVFGLRDRTTNYELACIEQDGAPRTLTLPVPDSVQGWLAHREGSFDGAIFKAPEPIRELVNPVLERLGAGQLWIVPIMHDGELAAGVVYRSETNERTRFTDDFRELRSFASSLGLALGRAHAQTAQRRMADDLAETNRRLQQMQNEVLRSRTLSMIAEMAAGAGHELNSPLTVISGRAQMLVEQLDNPEHRRSLEIIFQKAHECSRIVSDLMDFARPQPATCRQFDLMELLESIREEFITEGRVSAPRVVLRAAGLPEQRAVLVSDPKQLRVVVRELLQNAVEATADNQGLITITCRPAETIDGFEIQVSDKGRGMPPSIQERAFDPFFSHRKAGRRRGLGLPRAYRILESLDGRIWLESRPNEGTIVNVLLPRTEPESNRA